MVPQYALLPYDHRERLRGHVAVFLAEKRIDGCAGLVVTDEMRVTIAGFASLLLLGDDHDFFPRLHTVLLYPHEYRARSGEALADGTLLETEESRFGESCDLGAVVLTWDAVCGEVDPQFAGRNVVIHEFAHQLDDLGAGEGAPPLPDNRALRAAWAREFSRAFDAHVKADAAGEDTVIDPYGAEGPGEFFAVVVECFFEDPWALADSHRALYDLLAAYFKIDPVVQWKDPDEREVS